MSELAYQTIQNFQHRFLKELRDLVDSPTYDLVKRKMLRVRLDMASEALSSVKHPSEDMEIESSGHVNNN